MLHPSLRLAIQPTGYRGDPAYGNHQESDEEDDQDSSQESRTAQDGTDSANGKNSTVAWHEQSANQEQLENSRDEQNGTVTPG
jgi:hypothetical protein